MDLFRLQIGKIIEGDNSVLLETNENHILYEKLTNSIHVGNRDILQELQSKSETIRYSPYFESESLRKQKGGKIESLVLNITENCNLNCEYCIYSGNYENERLRNNSHMDFDIAKKAIDLFIPHAEIPPLISFYGGEPLKEMRLIEDIIDYSNKNYPRNKPIFSATSNFYDAENHFGSILKRDIHFLVSLDGPKEIHDRYRKHLNGEPTWDKTINNLKKLEKISPEYVKNNIGINVTCANQDNLFDIVEFFKKEKNFNVLRIGGLESKGLKNSSKFNNEKSFPLYRLSSDFLDYVKQEEPIPNVMRVLFEEKLKMLVQRDRRSMPEKLRLNGSCYPGNRKLFVNTDGRLYMCEKFGNRIPIGDVDNGLYQEKIDNVIEKFLDIRNNNCVNGCWAQRICNPCIQVSKDPKGDISMEGLSKMCDSLKNEILTSLVLYTEIIKNKKEYLDIFN